MSRDHFDPRRDPRPEMVGRPVETAISTCNARWTARGHGLDGDGGELVPMAPSVLTPRFVYSAVIKADTRGGPAVDGGRVRDFGELEARIMECMWAAESPRTVRDVHTELAAERTLAYTTVMTVMDKLHRKGWLEREPVGRAYVYRPRQSKERYTADLMNEALAASSDRGATLVAFLEQLTPAESRALRAALGKKPTRAHHKRRSRS